MRILESFFKNKQRRLSSAWDALREEHGEEIVRQALERCGDRRLLVRVVSESKGLSELDVLRGLGERLGLEVCERVPPMDLESCWRSFGTSLSDFRSSGTALVRRNGEAAALICANPDLAPIMDSLIGRTLPRKLASWESIATVLDFAEMLSFATDTESGLEPSLNPFDPARAVVSFVAWQMRELGGLSSRFSLAEARPDYEIWLRGGRRASGKIAPQVVPWIRRYVRESSGHLRIDSPDGAECYRMEAEERGDELSLRFASRDLEPGGVPARLNGWVLLADSDNEFRSVLARFFSEQVTEVVEAKGPVAAAKELRNRPAPPLLAIGEANELGLRLLDVGLGPVMLLGDSVDARTELDLVSAGAAAVLSKGSDPRLIAAYARNLMMGGMP